MYRLLISDMLGEAGLRRLETAEDATCDYRPDMSRADLLSAIAEYDALIVRSGTEVDPAVIEKGERLQVIGRAGRSVENIDVRGATLRGIIVMNTPRANSVAIAEQTMALMLALSRHTALAHASLQAGEWRRGAFIGVQLSDKTLGIIGFGHIGRLVAARSLSFGMDVIAYDPYVSEEVGREVGVLLVDLDDLLAQSDYVSLHTAVTTETTGVINAQTIALMKEGARLINTSRGALVNEAALAQALKEGKLSGAAVDVYESEPPQNSPLIGLDNVLHTPHLSANTVEAQRDVATQIVDQVLDALRGTDFRNTVNMPFPSGQRFADARPYMDLAEKMGLLQSALAPAPIGRVEVEVSGDKVNQLVRPVAAALLKGLLAKALDRPINLISAPLLAEEHGISITQTTGVASGDYPNLISCRVHWQGGCRVLSGALFGGSQPRIVQVDEFQLDAQPQGPILIMENEDVPGVIGQVGTILGAYKVNIGEWRMGREAPGGQALSFISLDGDVPPAVLEALGKIPAVTNLQLVIL